MNRVGLHKAIARHLGVRAASIARVINNAPHRYKHYVIPKRTGGMRHIYHPTPELKVIQRWIVGELLANVPVHPVVYSYMPGRSIAMHARVHVRSRYFLRLDFKDFFPSITDDVLLTFLRKKSEDGAIDLSMNAISDVVRLVCRFSVADGGGLALSIGAPSSPMISNMVLFDLDEKLSQFARSVGVLYTRYADDIYFSSSRAGILAEAEGRLREVIRDGFSWLSLNEGKSLRMTRKRRVTITGINVTCQSSISVGRGVKRKIKTEIYLVKTNNSDGVDVQRLRGLVSYCFGVEREFYNSLERKFGVDFMRNFMSGVR